MQQLSKYFKYITNSRPALLISLIVPALIFFFSFSSVSANYNLLYLWPGFVMPTQPPMPTYPPMLTRGIAVTPAPISTITPSPTPSGKPTSTPKPTPTSIPGTSPTSKPTTIPQPITIQTPIPVSTSAAVPHTDFIMNQINQFRAGKGLPAVKTDPYTCGFAQTRAGEITNGFNHDGFTNRLNSHNLPYPSYHLVNENIAMNSDYTQIETQWANSAGHNANMSADITYACVGQSGNYFAFEGWRP